MRLIRTFYYYYYCYYYYFLQSAKRLYVFFFKYRNIKLGFEILNIISSYKQPLNFAE